MSTPAPRSKRLSPAKLLILYVLHSRGSYPSSIIQLSRDMGYSTDSSVNKNLNDLIREGYVTDGPPFKLTEAGRRALQFTILPDVIVGLMVGVGLMVMIVSGETVFGLIGSISALANFGLGLACVALAVLFYGEKKRVFDDFLGVRKGLSPPESMPREEGETSSPG